MNVDYNVYIREYILLKNNYSIIPKLSKLLTFDFLKLFIINLKEEFNIEDKQNTIVFNKITWLTVCQSVYWKNALEKTFNREDFEMYLKLGESDTSSFNLIICCATRFNGWSITDRTHMIRI